MLGGGGTVPRVGALSEFWTKFSTTLASYCITDSLSHTTYVETNKGDKFVHYPEGWIGQPVLFDTQPDGCLFLYVGGDRLKKEYPQFIK